MPGERLARDFVPRLRGKARDEHVVLARKLPADLDDLRRLLAASQDDLRKAEPPQPVEVEGEVGKGHETRILQDRRPCPAGSAAGAYEKQGRDVECLREVAQ